MRPARVFVSGLLLSTAITLSSTLQAQPVLPVPALDPKAREQNSLTPSMALADLEKLIGGRTMLELNFKNATAEEATAALAQSSGLRFGRPLELPGLRAMPPGLRAGSELAATVEARRYNGAVPKMEFWPAVRLWSRSEAARLKAEREDAQRHLEAQRPSAPKVQDGQVPTRQAQQEWQTQQQEWLRRQSLQNQTFNLNRGVNVRFTATTQTWSLSPDNEIAMGRAQNAWPCLILATGLQRHQNLSIQENQAGETVQPKERQDAQANANRIEEIEGGQLNDGLSLDLSVFIEPKLLEGAQVRVVMSEARDDAGEELLSEAEKNNAVRQPNPNPFSNGGSEITRRVELRPRQSKGKKLALLRGVVLIRFPAKMQHEITDFTKPHLLPTFVAGYEALIRIEPPRQQDGKLTLNASAKVASETGSRAMTAARRSRNPAAPTGAFFGQTLLPAPTSFLLTDTQGRTWRALGGRRATWTYPQGAPTDQVPAPL